MRKNHMMGKRILGITIIVPLCLLLVFAGSWIFTLGVAAILSIASWEYWNFFDKDQYKPNLPFLIASVLFLCVSQFFQEGHFFIPTLVFLLLTSFIIHLIKYERGNENSLIECTYEIVGLMWIGMLGSFLVPLRFIEEGARWILLAIPAIGTGDIGAFLFGNAFGKIKMTPKSSPNKSLEGYFGGLLFTVLYSIIYSLILISFTDTQITLMNAIILGLVLGLFAPFGDLIESLFKRYFNKKDAGKLIPGHGGVLDRIDTWLVGGVLSYYLIIYFFI